MIPYLVPCVVLPLELTLIYWVAREMYKDYRDSIEQRRKQLAEHDICICKHERWYHTSTTHDPKDYKCYEFASPNHMALCGCTKFRMDNLLYLEKLVAERG